MILWISVSTTSTYTLHAEHKSICTWCWNAHTDTHTQKIAHAQGDRHLLQRTTHVTYYIYLQTCKSQMHAQLRGRMQREWVHELYESSAEIPLAHRGCFVFPPEGCSLFCGGRFSSRINEKLHLSHEKSIFTIYLTSCIPKAHIRHCWFILAYSSVFWCIQRHCCDLLWVGYPPPVVPIESLAFLMFTVRKLILQHWDEIWHTTGSLRELLKK